MTELLWYQMNLLMLLLDFSNACNDKNFHIFSPFINDQNCVA